MDSWYEIFNTKNIPSSKLTSKFDPFDKTRINKKFGLNEFTEDWLINDFLVWFRSEMKLGAFTNETATGILSTTKGAILMRRNLKLAELETVVLNQDSLGVIQEKKNDFF